MLNKQKAIAIVLLGWAMFLAWVGLKIAGLPINY